MGQWKGDSNPGGPGGSTRRIPAKGSGQHRRKRGDSGCAAVAVALAGSVLGMTGAGVWAIVEVLA